MQWIQTARIAFVVAVLMLSGTAMAAKGRLGFSTQATSTGLLHPTLERLEVATVRPGSAAASAGLQAGDLITEINGRAVAGAPAREMASTFKRVDVGQALRLKVRRGSSLVVLDIVARP